MGQNLSRNRAGNNARQISFSRLRRTTNDFNPLDRIGEGGSAIVYRGTIDDQVVAVKRLLPSEERNAEYDREVGVLSRVDHPNIINLIGCCSHRADRIVVYEFMPLGTLFDKLHARPAGEGALDWEARMKIGAGVARALSYLHNEANPRVIYRDLKPSNVLLGPSNLAKISDFGIAISDPPGQPRTVITTVLIGTRPYCSPEAALSDRLSSKSDVYSFGVLLLEIISGSVPLDPIHPQYVCNEARKPRNFVRMADPELRGVYPVDDLVRAMSLAVVCMRMRPSVRPDMSDVVRGMDSLAGVTGAVWPEEFNAAA